MEGFFRMTLCMSLLGMTLGGVTDVFGFQASKPNRRLKASSWSESSAVAESVTMGGTAESYAISSAVAEGNVNAISEAIANAISNGGHTAAVSVADAIGYLLDNGMSVDACAYAFSQAIGVDQDTVAGYLDEDNIKAAAEAIVSSYGGYAEVKAISFAEAVSMQENAICRAIERVFDKAAEGEGSQAVIEKQAFAIGKAFAQAFAETAVNIFIEGDGDGYGVSEANAESLCLAFSKVILKGIANAANKYGVAKAKFNGKAFATAIAEAAAYAYSEGYIEGPGYVETYQKSIAQAIAKPVAYILAEALAIAFENQTYAVAYLEASSYTEDWVITETESYSFVAGVGFATSTGRADAKTEQVFPCPRKDYTNGIDLCSKWNRNSKYAGCKGNYCQFKRSRYSSNEVVYWKDANSEKFCFCSY